MAYYVPRSTSECVIGVGVAAFPVAVRRGGRFSTATREDGAGTVTDVYVAVRADKVLPGSWACFPCLAPPEPASWATFGGTAVGAAAKAAARQVGCEPTVVDCTPSAPAPDKDQALSAELRAVAERCGFDNTYAHYAMVPLSVPESASRGHDQIAIVCCAWLQEERPRAMNGSTAEDPDGPAALAREQRLDLCGWRASHAEWVTRVALERHGWERSSADVAFLPIATNASGSLPLAVRMPAADLGLFCGVSSWKAAHIQTPPEAITRVESPGGTTSLELRCPRVLLIAPDGGSARPDACVFLKDCSDPGAFVGSPYGQRAPRRCSVALNGALVVDRTRTRALDCVAVADLDVVPTVGGCHVMRVDPPAGAAAPASSLCAYSMPVMLPPLSVAVLEDVWCGGDTAAFALSIATPDGSARTFFVDPQHKYHANGVKAVYATEDRDLFARMLVPFPATTVAAVDVKMPMSC